jgi:hypothetical protein
MERKLSITIIFVLFLSVISIAQDSKWSLGFQAGRTQLIGFTRGSFQQIPDFEAQGMGGVNIQLYARYNVYKRVSVYASGGINNLVSGMRFQGKRGRNFGTKGVTPQYFVGIDYDIPFGESGFGVISRIAYGITGSNAREMNLDRYTSENEGFPVIGSIAVDQLTGEREDLMIYIKDVQILASDYKFIYHIRPELSIYKKYGPHQFSISAVYALAPDRNFYTENFFHLEYKENRHTGSHHFGGHYTALLFGYEFRF